MLEFCLPGGGLKGVALSGAMFALRTRGVVPDVVAGISSGGVRRKSDSLVAIMTILKLPHSHCILPGRGGFRTSRRMNRDVPMSYGI